MRQPIWALVPLGLARLFTDQVVPSVGLSGTLLMVSSLERRGVPRGVSTAAMLANLVTYYAAYAVVVGGALIALWCRGELTRAMLAIATVFTVVAVCVPVAVFWLRGRATGRGWLPGFVARLPLVRDALAALAEAPAGVLREWGLLAALTVIQADVFVLDAATLAVMLRALGSPVAADVVLAAFALASVIATLGWVPGGLGTFDATCVAVLHWHGVTLEAALAATLLLRGFTFWLPMIPGVWLARRELSSQGAT